MEDSGKQGEEKWTKEGLEEVEAILGYEFKNKGLLEEAFTHSTYVGEKCFSYERLEYVGDAVLNLLVTKEHFSTYTDLAPGDLTLLRAANVDTEKLARVAIKHGLHRYLRHKKPRLQEKIQEFIKGIAEYPLHSNGLIDVPKNLADIVESTIGAVFIDCGSSVDVVWKVFKTLLEPMIDPGNIQKHPVTQLYEVCQKQNLKIKFVDLWKDSMSFNVIIDEKLVGTGIYGTKKQIAISRAAKDALNNIDIVLSTKKVTNEHVL
ncbi:ribonuclease 3-like protein 3 [Abrus precatorius]|uniref:Ribonuclease 3-like protein 3 n=1 Tax=Abrus precatorius TaxID=3816 RepID=A0A8B8KFA0_ABRPR|nr:ribonuclease 3-like protein 3 [Abrus precatorius]